MEKYTSKNSTALNESSRYFDESRMEQIVRLAEKRNRLFFDKDDYRACASANDPYLPPRREIIDNFNLVDEKLKSLGVKGAFIADIEGFTKNALAMFGGQFHKKNEKLTPSGKWYGKYLPVTNPEGISFFTKHYTETNGKGEYKYELVNLEKGAVIGTEMGTNYGDLTYATATDFKENFKSCNEKGDVGTIADI